MKPASQVICLVIDRGLFAECAIRLAQDFKEVYYHVPNDSDPFAVWNASIIGHGMENIEVVDSIFGDHFPEVDLVVFPDVGMGELQEHMVSIGKKVWGSRMGCDLELDRPYAKELLESVGLPVGPHKIIKGVRNLRAWLKEHKDQYVKVSKWRGSTESFESQDYKQIEPHLDEMEFSLGPLKEIITFDVEEALPDRCEVGSDSWSVDGVTPKTHLCGIEVKDSSYCGRILKPSEIPQALQTVDEKMSKLLKAFGYRGNYSTEVRVGRDKVPYMIDFTARLPNPPGFLQTLLFKNYSEIMWHGANGECLEPEYEHACGVQLQMKSSWSDQEHWMPVDFDPKFRRQILLVNPCKIAGQYYTVPLRFGIKECGGVIGTGDSIEAAVKSAKKAADTVSGYTLKVDASVLEDAMDACADAKALGCDLGIN